MAEKKKKMTLAETKAAINKEYGEGSIISGKDIPPCTDIVSTGSLGLDIATGVGGFPMDGRIIEWIGWSSCGKSTGVQTFIGNYQKAYPDKAVVYTDSEHSLDAIYSPALGVNLDELNLIQMDEHGGEAAYEKVEMMVDTGEVGLVIYDSYNGLQPLKVIQEGLTDSNMGLHARLLGKAVVRSAAANITHKTNFIFIGQLREKIGVLWGDNTTTQGGKALEFYSHMRLKSSRSTTVKNSVTQDDMKMGNEHTVEVFKNKLSAPFRKAKFNIIYGEGIDIYDELNTLGLQYEIFTKSGAYITCDGQKYKNADFLEKLKTDKKFFADLRKRTLDAGLNNVKKEAFTAEPETNTEE